MANEQLLNLADFEASKQKPVFTFKGWVGSTNVTTQVMYMFFDQVKQYGESQPAQLSPDKATAYIDALVQKFEQAIQTTFG